LARTMALSARHDDHNDFGVLGEDESHAIEVSSGSSDSESGARNIFTQGHGSPRYSIASHNPAPPPSPSVYDFRRQHYLGKDRKISSVSGERTFARSTTLVRTECAACEGRRKTKVGR